MKPNRLSGMSEIDPLIEGLNPQQAEAVTHVGGPLLVVAGAGSGKTRVLTRRIAYLMAPRNVAPYQILAITFTNKAAGEMKERVADLVGPIAKSMWVSTFHSACARILRTEANRLGYSNNFTIYDSADSLRLITIVLRDLNLDSKRYPAKQMQAMISNAKNELHGPMDYLNSTSNQFQQVVADVFADTRRRARDCKAARGTDQDFGAHQTEGERMSQEETIAKLRQWWMPWQSEAMAGAAAFFYVLVYENTVS